MNMINRVTIAGVILMGLMASAQAEEVDESRDVDPNGLIKMKNLRGEISIQGWDKSVVRVQGDLDDLATGLRFEVRGDETQIEVKMPGRDVNWGDGSDLTIMVPSKSRIAVDSVSSDVDAEDVGGRVQIRTVSGDIELTGGTESISLKTVSGGILVKDSQGSLRVSSSSGEIDVRSHEGDAELQTMSGEINLSARGAKQIRGSTISGEIDADVSFLPGVQAEFTSVSGEISIDIDNPADLSILANSTSGDISNGLTDDEVKEAFGQSSLQVNIGEGTGFLNVRAVSGAIDIDEG